MNISTGAVGAELLAGRIRRVEAAPWEREGAGLHSPDDPQAREAAQRWSAAVATMDANERDTEVARVRREEARRHRREDEEAANAKKLENNAKRMFLIGFAGLPFVWLVSVLYFREELRNENANPNIKKHVRLSAVMFVVYTLVFLLWVVIYQTKKSELQGLSILEVKNHLS